MTRGSAASSTSRTGFAPEAPDARADATPEARFAPVSLETTPAPEASRAATSRRVVVVLPLVPETTTAPRPAASSPMTPGATARATRPPIVTPAPIPARRETRPASRPARTARAVRAERGDGEPWELMRGLIWPQAYAARPGQAP